MSQDWTQFLSSTKTSHSKRIDFDCCQWGNVLLEDKKWKICIYWLQIQNEKSEDQLVRQGSRIFEPSKLIYSCTYLHLSKKIFLRLSSRDTPRYRSASSKYYWNIYIRLQESNLEAAANLSSTFTSWRRWMVIARVVRPSIFDLSKMFGRRQPHVERTMQGWPGNNIVYTSAAGENRTGQTSVIHATSNVSQRRLKIIARSSIKRSSNILCLRSVLTGWSVGMIPVKD